MSKKRSIKSTLVTKAKTARSVSLREQLGVPQIADHKLIRRIGRGSYGEVWPAKNVMAIFGAPLACEDHAQRAVLAALGSGKSGDKAG